MVELWPVVQHWIRYRIMPREIYGADSNHISQWLNIWPAVQHWIHYRIIPKETYKEIYRADSSHISQWLNYGLQYSIRYATG